MAAPVGELPQVGLLCTFGVGAFVMRGAGCTINDLWDREIDAKVERTKTRPLASGVSRLYAHRSKSATLQSSRFVQALSVAQAVGFLGVQLSVGLAVLLSLNKSVALAQSPSRVSRFCYQQLRPQCACAAQHSTRQTAVQFWHSQLLDLARCGGDAARDLLSAGKGT